MIETYDSYFDPENYPLELCFKRKTIYVGGVKVILNRLPYLLNTKTQKIYFPGSSAVIINDYVKDVDGCEVRINQFKRFDNGKFEIARYSRFKYSPVEHFVIPGLIRNMPSDGFLTPVYFDPNILVMYEYGNGYSLIKNSESYGVIKFSSNESVKYGVNKRGFVVMWLGDILSLPDNEKEFLYSQNVDPQYDIHSDFYNAEIMNSWIR